MDTDLNASRIAAIHFQRDFHIDGLLADLCRRLAGDGLKMGGLLQQSSGGAQGYPSSLHLVDLRSRATFDIWEYRGAHAQGCRLDEAGLLDAAHIIDKAIDDRVDLLVINRFGSAESLGRGLLPYFASALEADIAVLTSVREPYVDAWRQFHGGIASEFGTDPAALLAWARAKAPAPQL